MGVRQKDGGTVAELKELLVTYAKQETVDPLKALGRYLAFGVAGSLLIGLSVIFLSLALLRALQTETGSVLDGNWSWAPYALTLVAVVVVLAATGLAIKKVKDDEMGGGARSEMIEGRSVVGVGVGSEPVVLHSDGRSRA